MLSCAAGQRILFILDRDIRVCGEAENFGDDRIGNSIYMRSGGLATLSHDGADLTSHQVWRRCLGNFSRGS